MNVWVSARRNGDEDEDVFVFLLTGATSLSGGEIIGILTVLFRFLGYGFRLGDVQCQLDGGRGSSRYWCPTRSLLRHGQASLCDICQHKTRLVELSPRVGMRTGKSDVYQQPIAGLSKRTLGRGDNVSVLVTHSHHKSTGGRSGRWRHRRSSARRGGLEEARLVNLARQSH